MIDLERTQLPLFWRDEYILQQEQESSLDPGAIQHINALGTSWYLFDFSVLDLRI